MRRLERGGFLTFFQHARDRVNRGACLDGRGTGDVGDQQLAEFFRIAQIGVGLDEGFLFHGCIVPECISVNADSPLDVNPQ